MAKRRWPVKKNEIPMALLPRFCSHLYISPSIGDPVYVHITIVIGCDREDCLGDTGLIEAGTT
jgi:hypothetical protein